MSEDAKDKKQRSPAYPFISLEAAVDRARQFWQRENKHAAPVTNAASHWGYKEKSSGVMQTVSALKQYGLLEDDGSKAERKVCLTVLAKKILLDEVPDSPARASAIKTAALGPKIHGELFRRYGTTNYPSEQTMRTLLRLEMGYNETALHGIIKNYKDTIAYAKLGESDTMGDTAGRPEPDEQIAPGDYVSWESQGVVQFEARRVVSLSLDGSHVLVEGSSTGLPKEQVTKVEPPKQSPRSVTNESPEFASAGVPRLQAQGVGVVTAPVVTSQPGFINDVCSFKEGVAATLQWPTTLSAESVDELLDWLELMVKKIKGRQAAQLHA